MDIFLVFQYLWILCIGLKRINSRWADIITICACLCIELQRTNDGRLVWPEAITPTPLGPQIQMNSAPNHQQKPEEEEENRMFTSTFIEQNTQVSRIPLKNGHLDKSKKNTTCSMFLNLEPSWIVVCSTVALFPPRKRIWKESFHKICKMVFNKVKVPSSKVANKEVQQSVFLRLTKEFKSSLCIFRVLCFGFD